MAMSTAVAPALGVKLVWPAPQVPSSMRSVPAPGVVVAGTAVPVASVCTLASACTSTVYVPAAERWSVAETAVLDELVVVWPQVVAARQLGGEVAQGRDGALDLAVLGDRALDRRRLGLQRGERLLLDRHQLGDDRVDVQAAADACRTDRAMGDTFLFKAPRSTADRMRQSRPSAART